MKKISLALIWWWAVLGAAIACAQTHATQEHRIRVSTLTEGLSHPWSIAFLPDGRLLVTERAGRLRVIGKDFKLETQPIGGVPEVAVVG